MTQNPADPPSSRCAGSCRPRPAPTWYGLFGPANLPPELTERIARTIAAASRPAAVRDKISELGTLVP